MDYIDIEQKNWRHQPQIFAGEGFQDCIILVFGKPETAVFAHMDTVGFTVRYQNQLLSIGSPEPMASDLLYGNDNLGEILCKTEFDTNNRLYYEFGRGIERGTSLTYSPNFNENNKSITSPYLDNRVGLFVGLELAKVMENGALVFSCGEEHGGGYAGFLARFLFEEFKISKALIADVTWDTDGVDRGKGVAISLRDAYIPRRKFIDSIINLANGANVKYQLEVEGSGGSDGSEIQQLPYPIDWCFIGAPILNPHTSQERVFKNDIREMIKLYTILLEEL